MELLLAGIELDGRRASQVRLKPVRGDCGAARLARRVGRVEAGALARHEADYVAVVPVREANKLPPLLGDRHAGGDRIEAAGAQFRDQPLPFLQHDLAFGTELCAERKRDVDVEARDLAGIVDIGERRIAAGRGDTQLLCGERGRLAPNVGPA